MISLPLLYKYTLLKVPFRTFLGSQIPCLIYSETRCRCVSSSSHLSLDRCFPLLRTPVGSSLSSLCKISCVTFFLCPSFSSAYSWCSLSLAFRLSVFLSPPPPLQIYLFPKFRPFVCSFASGFPPICLFVLFHA